MAYSKKKTNYRKKYPNLDEEVIDMLVKSDRKLEYHFYDLKVGKFMINSSKQTVAYIPSREVSYELLVNEKQQFADGSVDVEDTAIKAILIQRLHTCIKLLTPEEQALIDGLFFKGKSERNLAEEWGIPRMTLHDKKVKTLQKLKRLIQN